MPPAGAPPELITVRDFLRYAVSRFRAAGLAHGHGATTALDEAAFLILETLNLPVDDINPWADARLTQAERDALAKIVALRVETRKPAAYLLKRTYMHGVPFYIDERAIVPRSYIGELLFSNLFGGGEASLIADPEDVSSVLDLCTGSGCLAILAAGIFRNAAIDAADLSGDALDVARVNLEQHGLSGRIKLVQGDLFKPLESRRYDLILANPPYVAAAEMAAFPPEYAQEPAMAHAGGHDGLDIVRRILAAAPHHLNDGGGLLCEIGTGRDILEAEFPALDFLWLDTEESEGEVFWLTRDAFSA
ncbi:MAG TPA: 50S ribosomal protein L3 N(5)-glutamine methyltransferase [Kiloniellales bacterium]